MKALTIRQPWAWLIVQGYKDIENRTWATGYRGPLLIHAAKRKMSADDVELLEELCRILDVRPPEALSYGGIIGVATLTDCVQHHPSEWFTGPVGWVLTGVEPLPFVACRGRLGLFELENPYEAL